MTNPRCDARLGKHTTQDEYDRLPRCRNFACIRVDPALGFLLHIQFFCRVHMPPNYAYGYNKQHFWISVKGDPSGSCGKSVCESQPG